MTNIEKLRAAIRAREEAMAEISRIERETGLDAEMADLSDEQVRKIRDVHRDLCKNLPARGSMSLEKSIYLQMRNEIIARSRSTAAA